MQVLRENLIGLGGNPISKEAQPIARKRVLMIIAPEDFNDHELLEPKAILEEEGMKVMVGSTLTGACKGMSGTQVTSEISVAQVDPAEYDGVIVVGGSGAQRFLWNDQVVLDLVRSFHQRGKMVAAIGRGRHVLVNLNLFPGKSLFWGPPTEIEGNVIAGRPPATTPGWSSKAFGRIVAEYLSKVRGKD